MSWALVFAGQGMQHADMLRWLGDGTAASAGKAVLLDMEARLGSAWRQRLADPAWAGGNAHAQLLLTGLALAAWAELQPLLPPPAIVAGYSVGEIAAFAAAGVFDAASALSLAPQRAACMDEAAAGQETGLMAVTGGAPDAISALCQRFDLDVAIRNAADSMVLGGPRTALDAAADAASAMGLRCVPLNVALASHTRWLAPAAASFARQLQSQSLAAPRRPLVSNALGRVRNAQQACEALAVQIATTVRWDECMEAIAAQRVQAVLEIGPGQSLAKLWQQYRADIPARSADEFRSAASIAAWLHKALQR